MRTLGRGVRFAIVCALLIAAMVVAGGATAANNSEQVVFSGVGTQESPPHVFGFWIWCEAESSNPYAGACQGAMYFYDLGVTTHVSGFVTEFPADSGLYTMHVFSSTNSVLCTLSNHSATLQHGPGNQVDVVCSVGATAVTGSSFNSVVNVTGP